MRDLAFVIMFVPMLLLSIRHIHTGTMLWIWTALASPNEYFYSYATQIPLNKLAVAATFIAVFIDAGRRKPNFDMHMVFLLLLLLQGILSCSFGLTDFPRTYDLLDKMTKISILCLVMTTAGRGRLQIHATVLVLCFSLGIKGVLDGLKFIASAGTYKAADSPTLGDNNYIALAGLMVLPLVLYLIRYCGSRALRVLLTGMFFAICLGIVSTASRGGLIGLVVLGVLSVVQGRRKVAAALLVGALAAGLVLIAPERWSQRMETIQTAEDDSSFMGRVMAWKMNTLVALDRPLLGGGYSALEDPRVFAAYLPRFHALDLIPTDAPTRPAAAHSIYFEALGDLGFLGLFLFLAMLITGLRNVRRIRILTRGDPATAWADDLALALRAVVIVFMVTGAALSAVYFEALYVMLTLLSVLRWHIEDQAVPVVVARRFAVADAVA
jgi:probable O-glycosylation ligase (exosortase A-associated)